MATTRVDSKLAVVAAQYSTTIIDRNAPGCEDTTSSNVTKHPVRKTHDVTAPIFATTIPESLPQASVLRAIPV